MDVSDILASSAAKQKLTTVEKEVPLQVDAGLLTVTDLNPVDKESYDENTEDYLLSTARDGVQTLIAALAALPTVPSPYGPLSQLPPATTELPRAKPLPKPKPPTKWEQFAKAKGIQKKRKDRKVWDEEKQEWINRWGRDAKNKEGEDMWLSEVKLGADVSHDPAQELRTARKVRVAKNERQRLRNIAHAQGSSQVSEREQRTREIDRTLATTRVSTASMGRFDKQLESEKKLRGVKRKFDSNERSVEEEKKNSLAIISKLESETNRARKEKSGGDDILNVRKAIRSASRGKGSAALSRDSSGKGRGKKGKR
ncbi:RRS1-domain-containing protein [Neolentinus lepideus HHB14362 ss-1]|uniref:Ribosome biogenesis regulatory protein n=1 Tax=Neolentinus lepideus HHB14362 ss-1 TaxID=1314782 RepID=A0A165S223_9AGAM|nr:RRS1-domain-containing protein [Neolentinus lepideus HHB14362 ss-1]